MSIEVRSIRKSFGPEGALAGVDLTIESGELVALLGPSGSGKTTLLRVIAGLEGADDAEGAVLFDGRDVTEWSAAARGVGFVFQHYALFRHMRVFDNVAFGLKARPRELRPRKGAIRARVMELLRLVQLEDLERRFPDQLSGGQRQRVAFARALAIEPSVLLLDEPFGALDAKVRLELRRWVRTLHDRLGTTSLFVTHDQEEALDVADRVVILNQGKVEQAGTPADVYQRPATAFVMRFLGQSNCLPGRSDGRTVAFEGLARELTAETGTAAGAVDVFVRPHELALEAAGTAGLPVRLVRVQPAGAVVRVELAHDRLGSLSAELSHERWRALDVAPGTALAAVPRAFRIFASG